VEVITKVAAISCYYATYCNTLQHAATRCNTLQHSHAIFSGIYTARGCLQEMLQQKLPPSHVLTQHTATHFNPLQHTATHFNPLQHTATRPQNLLVYLKRCRLRMFLRKILRYCNSTHCNTLQHSNGIFISTYTAHVCCSWRSDFRNSTYCNTLQHTSTHCNTLPHTATHCNILQHSHGIFSSTYTAHVCCSWRSDFGIHLIFIPH